MLHETSLGGHDQRIETTLRHEMHESEREGWVGYDRELFRSIHKKKIAKLKKSEIEFYNAVQDAAIEHPNSCPKVSLQKAKSMVRRRNYRAQLSPDETKKRREKNSNARRIARANMNSDETKKLREKNSNARRIARGNMDSDGKDAIRREDRVRKRVDRVRKRVECEQETEFELETDSEPETDSEQEKLLKASARNMMADQDKYLDTLL